MMLCCKRGEICWLSSPFRNILTWYETQVFAPGHCLVNAEGFLWLSLGFSVQKHNSQNKTCAANIPSFDFQVETSSFVWVEMFPAQSVLSGDIVSTGCCCCFGKIVSRLWLFPLSWISHTCISPNQGFVWRAVSWRIKWSHDKLFSQIFLYFPPKVQESPIPSKRPNGYLFSEGNLAKLTAMVPSALIDAFQIHQSTTENSPP